jgi:hypothetical protein
MFVGVLHVGHRNWDLVLPFESCDILTCCCKHVSQNECRHGRALGGELGISNCEWMDGILIGCMFLISVIFIADNNMETFLF